MESERLELYKWLHETRHAIGFAKRMLHKLQLRHEAGELDNDFEFTELVERFFRARSGQGGLRPSTVARYRECVELFVDTCMPKHVSDITPDDAVRAPRGP